jgi:hypothetical protein
MVSTRCCRCEGSGKDRPIKQLYDDFGGHGVLNCLNQRYYETTSDESRGLLIGSWGKDTATRPPRDVDTYFILPPEVHARFEMRIGNRQSALLQEVRNVLMPTYPTTEMRSDGHVVIVRFGSYAVEVVPAFLLTNGRYWICDTSGQGSYKVADPDAEARYIEQLSYMGLWHAGVATKRALPHRQIRLQPGIRSA